MSPALSPRRFRAPVAGALASLVLLGCDAGTPTAGATVDAPAPDASIVVPARGDAGALPRYGAGRTGPRAEACETAGTPVEAASEIVGAGTFLLRGGTYGSVTVPAGAIVKPYDCEPVTIAGSVELGDGATLAGVTVTSDEAWVLEIDGSDITVRHNTITGGTTEAVRIHGDARDVTLVGNRLDGGRDHHVVKVSGEEGARPDDILIHANRLTRQHYDTPGEDLLQLEGHVHVTITHNTFAQNPRGEDGIDVKQGTDGALVASNRFVGTAIREECLLVQGGRARTIVRDNLFATCEGVSIGASPEEGRRPWWRFARNVLRDSTLFLRQSAHAEVLRNTMTGGVLKLGVEGGGDTPHRPRVFGNTFRRVTVENRLRPGDYQCGDNTFVEPRGDALRCGAGS